MKKLTLTIAGNLNFDPEILINDERLKYKKNKFKHRIYEVETDKEEIDIKIFKWYELEGKWGFAVSIVFFIISLFGLFDIRDDRKPYSLKYNGKIRLNSEEDGQLKIILNSFKPGEQAFVWEGNCNIDYNDTSKYFIDEEVNKKRMKLKKIKRATRLCAMALLIITTVLLLI